MFRTIVWAILFIELWIPLICGILWCLFDGDDSIWCRVFAIAIVALIIILV